MDGSLALYRHSLALLTDLYQLTMSYGYWKLGRADELAAFHLFFRRPPFGGGCTIACGLGPFVEYLRAVHFEAEDLAYLATIRGTDGQPLFEAAFLDHLGRLEWTVDIDAVPEGTAVFPHEPLVRVTGPILQCQLLETPLLNCVNFQTLIATKAARICQAAEGESVLEFGLRRAQGIDGGVSASRAAYVGGCAGTSNLLAGKLFGIPVVGTHAHSWVMLFDDDLEAFDAYARCMPNNCIFLVDTYDSLAGVRHAVAVGRRLRERGHELLGIRLDSGDLTYLSREARRMLDEAGFPNARIVGGNELDEHLIESIKHQGGQIAVWAVGTRLVTGGEDAALTGVYKLTAIRNGDTWQPRIKLSEHAVKSTTPGILQVRRFTHEGQFVADMLWDQTLGLPAESEIVDPLDPTRRRPIPPDAGHADLLVPIFRGGKLVYEVPPLGAVRARTQAQVAALHPAIRRLTNPHEYPAGLAPNLHELKTQLIVAARARRS